LITACGNASTERDRDANGVLVFAAASTADVLGRIAKAYEVDTGVNVECSFAASSTLSRQIEAGAPADIYLSADPQWMDRLEKLELIRPESRRDLLANTLVLITPRENRFEVFMESDFRFANAFEGRLALGDPSHVPAGRYARQALESLGWWNALQKRMIPALDVRDALRLVALGEAAAGIVYATDAAGSDRVSVIGAFPAETYEPIRYPVAICKDASPDAAAFADYLFGEEATSIFQSAGFTLLLPSDS
jgi:molybdate transport system substrate-binding protein